MSAGEKRRHGDDIESNAESPPVLEQSDKLLLCDVLGLEEWEVDGYRSNNSKYTFFKPTSVKLEGESLGRFLFSMSQHEPWARFLQLKNQDQLPATHILTFVDKRFYATEANSDTVHEIESIQVIRCDLPASMEILVTWPGQLKPESFVEEFDVELDNDQLYRALKREQRKRERLERVIASHDAEQNEATRSTTEKLLGEKIVLNMVEQDLDERERRLYTREQIVRLIQETRAAYYH